jgi:hypothetical protein
MGRRAKGKMTVPESREPELRFPWRSRVVIAASVPIYFSLAWLLASLLPDHSFVAWVPLAFGIHSVVVLLFSWGWRPGGNSAEKGKCSRRLSLGPQTRNPHCRN